MPVEPIGERPPPGETSRWDNYHKTGHSTLRARFALRSAELNPGRADIAEGAQAVHIASHRSLRHFQALGETRACPISA